jgi:hypothetical protein
LVQGFGASIHVIPLTGGCSVVSVVKHLIGNSRSHTPREIFSDDGPEGPNPVLGQVRLRIPQKNAWLPAAPFSAGRKKVNLFDNNP